MVNTKKCYLCDRKASKEKKISLHQFPSVPHIRKKWIDACGLYDTDEIKSLQICSRHFARSCIIESRKLSRLKPTAVPSINVPQPNVCEVEDVENVDANNIWKVETKYLPTVEEQYNVQSTRTHEILNAKSISEKVEVDNLLPVTEIKEEYDIVDTESMSQNESSPEVETLDISTASTQTEEITNIAEMVATSGEIESVNNKDLNHCRNRVYAHPRYISEIEESDFETPFKRRITINFIKAKDKERIKKVKRLQSRNRKLTQRIKSMQNLLAHFRDKGLMSEEATDTNMTLMPGKRKHKTSTKIALH